MVLESGIMHPFSEIDKETSKKLIFSDIYQLPNVKSKPKAKQVSFADFIEKNQGSPVDLETWQMTEVNQLQSMPKLKNSKIRIKEGPE